MMVDAGASVFWTGVRTALADLLGWQIGPDRLADLERNLQAAATELRLGDASACGRVLIAGAVTAEQLQVIANHLMVGETYFFREPALFEALSSDILPALIHERNTGSRRLRIWCAGCCTGEEPYSIAMMLRQLMPDIESWQVEILATDISPRFLEKAAAGIYGEWSFRDTTPPGVREQFFHRLPGGRYLLAPEVRRMVRFAQLNLAEACYPSPLNQTAAMDIILCRNVLMYFTLGQALQVVQRLRDALSDDGLLAVSAVECGLQVFEGFQPVMPLRLALFRKGAAGAGAGIRPPVAMPERQQPWVSPPLPIPQQPLRTPAAASAHNGGPVRPAQALLAGTPSQMMPAPAAVVPIPVIDAAEVPALSAIEALQREGRHADVIATLHHNERWRDNAAALRLLAQSLADLGRLDEALACCERWLARDKLNPGAYYLRALVLLERGDRESATAALQRAVFLRPDFVAGHLALGNVARGAGRVDMARRHFRNARQLLHGVDPEQDVDGCDGLNAGRLTQMLDVLIEVEAAA